jgi:signal transduction histidine kinase/GAF domain-containing protein/CheY-like chemotaxis protein
MVTTDPAAGPSISPEGDAVLRDLWRLLHSGAALEDIFPRVERRVARIVPCTTFGIMFATGRAREFRVVGTGCSPEGPGGGPLRGEAILDGLGGGSVPVTCYGLEAAPVEFQAALRSAGVTRAAVAVLRIHGERFGLLQLGRRETGFTEGEVAFLEAAASLVAECVAERVHLERARSAERRGELLTEVSILLNAGEPIDRIFDQLLLTIRETLDYDYVECTRFRSATGTFEIAVTSPPQDPPVIVSAASKKDIELIKSSGQAVVQYRPDLVRSEGAQRFATRGLKRMLSGVVEQAGEVFGIFSIGRRVNVPFDAAEEAFLAVVITIVGQAMANEQRLERARSEAARHALIGELALLLGAGQQVEAMLERVEELVEKAVSADQVRLAKRIGPDRWVWLGTRAGALDATPRDAQVLRILETGHRFIQFRPRADEDPEIRAIAETGAERAFTCVIQEDGETLGLFNVGRTRPERFSEDETSVLSVVAELLGRAMARDERLARAERGERRNWILSDLSLLANSGEPAATMVQKVRQVISGVIDFDWMVVHLLDGPGGGFETLISEPHLDAGTGDMEPALRDGMSSVLGSGGSVAQFRPELAPGALAAAASAAGIRRAITAVLQHSQGPMGVLTLGRFANEPFLPEDVGFIESVARLLAQALANQVHLAAVETAAARRRVLNEAAVLLNAGEPVEELFGRIPDILTTALPFENLTLFVAQDEVRSFTTHNVGPLAWFGNVDVEPEFFGMGSLVSDGRTVVPARWADVPSTFGTVMVQAGQVWGAMALLRDRDEILGALAVSRSAGQGFSESETSFLEVLATFFGQAAANQARIRRSEREAYEQRLIATITASVAGEPNLEKVVETMNAMLRDFVPGALVGFGFVDGDEVVFPGGPAEDVRATRTGLYSLADRDGMPDNLFTKLGAQSAVLTASRSGGATIGYLLVASTLASYEFPERTLRVLRLIAQVGPALSNARAAEQMRLHAAEQELVAQVASRVAQAADPVALSAALQEALEAFVPEPLVAYGFLEQDTIAWQTQRGPLRLAIGRTARAAMESGHTVVNTDEMRREHPGRKVLQGLRVAHSVQSASYYGGRVLGLLHVSSRTKDHQFSDRDLRIIELIAQMVGPAMENARASERTARERALYDLALSSLSESIILLDHEFRVTYRNPAAETVVSAVLGEGEAMTDAAHRFDPAVQVAIARAAAGEPARALMNLQIAGEARTFDFEILPLSHPQFRTLVVGVDVTQRVRREEEALAHATAMAEAARATAEQKDLYELVLNTLSEGVILVDGNSNAILVNPLGERIARALDPNRQLGSVDEIAATLKDLRVRADFLSAMTGGGRRQGRAAIDLDGEQRWMDYEFIPLSGAEPRLLTVASDVTAEVHLQAEQARQQAQMAQSARLAALGELIGGIAHELNNPLTAILGSAELLAVAGAISAGGEELEILRKEAQRARDVVRDLLFIARPEAVNNGPVQLSEIVGHIERLGRSARTQHGIAFSADFTGAPLPVDGNEQQLTQVLLNLVTNAERALEGVENPQIAISASQDSTRTTIVVRDNGKGMDEATLERIFDPFFTGRPGEGTGLGLSLSHSIVQAHGGTISAESEPGAGTSFQINLPTFAAAVGAPPAAPPTAAADGGRRLNVLVVDDEPSLRKVAKMLITRLGHDCETIESSWELADAVGQNEFDVVITDYRLGTETADAVLSMLAEIAPRLIERTTLATGATTDTGVLELTRRYNIGLVAKPYGVEQLNEILARAQARNPG